MSFIAGYLLGLDDGKESVLENLTVTENGVYTPDEGTDGFDRVEVNVPSGQADIQALTVTSNGTYYAESYGCDGFDPVNVNVDDGSERIAELEQEVADSDRNIDDIFDQLKNYLETGEAGNIPANDRNLGVMTQFKRIVSGEGTVTVEDSDSAVKLEWFTQANPANHRGFLHCTVTNADGRQTKYQVSASVKDPDGKDDYFYPDPDNGLISITFVSSGSDSRHNFAIFKAVCVGSYLYYDSENIYTYTLNVRIQLTKPDTFGSGSYVIL